jgi:hypothetical protein
MMVRVTASMIVLRRNALHDNDLAAQLMSEQE